MTKLLSAVKDSESKLGALEKMNGLSVGVDAIAKGSRGSSYHLLILNSLEKTVTIQGYDRESFAQAEEDYSTFERRAIDGEKLEPVLVSAGSIEKLRRAYPSFFLDIGDLPGTQTYPFRKTRIKPNGARILLIEEG